MRGNLARNQWCSKTALKHSPCHASLLDHHKQIVGTVPDVASWHTQLFMSEFHLDIGTLTTDTSIQYTYISVTKYKYIKNIY